MNRKYRSKETMPEPPKNRDKDPDADKAREREEAQRADELRRRQELEGRRALCTTLLFWHICRDKRCKRAHACAGDVAACFSRFWPQVPEDIKDTIRRMIELTRDGMPQPEAAIAAVRDIERRKTIEEEALARHTARMAVPPPAPAPPNNRARHPARAQNRPRASRARLRLKALTGAALMSRSPPRH
jgi:hypothetical protein